MKTHAQLKQMYIRKKAYRTRGSWGRLNRRLFYVIKNYGYDAWLEVAKKL